MKKLLLTLLLTTSSLALAQDITNHAIPVGGGPGAVGWKEIGPCTASQLMVWVGGTGSDPSCSGTLPAVSIPLTTGNLFFGVGGVATDSTFNTTFAFQQPSQFPINITSGHKICFADSDCTFGNAYSNYPLGVVSAYPTITGKAGSSIGSSTPGQTFNLQFTSTGLSGSPITVGYTAIGGDTTATIAASVCNAINANATLHNATTGQPIFCQSFSGSAIFNIQYTADFSATGATPLTIASTGTGTITLPGEANTLDFVVMQLGRNVPGRAARNNDALFGLDFTGQDSTGAFNTHYAQITVAAINTAPGSQRGHIHLHTAEGNASVERIHVGQGFMVNDSAGAMPTGGDLGGGTVNAASGYYVNNGLVNGLTITPSQITTSQNDYAPTGNATASEWRLSTNGPHSITGIAGGIAGRTLRVRNDGGNFLILTNNSASSAAGNRFDMNQDLVLFPRESATLWYDGTTGFWKLNANPPQLFNGILSLSGVVSPAQITTDQNDYGPANINNAHIMRISSDAARNITGLAAHRTGEIMAVINVGSFPITLINQSVSSSAVNRFSFISDVVLPPNGVIILWWDVTTSRWRQFGSPVGGGLVFDQNSHVSTKQATAPTITAGCNGAGSSVGTGSTDTYGTITGQTTAATTCTITFGTAFANVPHCVTSGQTSPLTGAMTPSTSTLVVNFASTANYKWSYHCMGT